VRVEQVFFDMNDTIERFEAGRSNVKSLCIEVLQACMPGLVRGKAGEAFEQVRVELIRAFGEYPIEHHYVFWARVFRVVTSREPTDVELGGLFDEYVRRYLSMTDIFDDAAPALEQVSRLGVNCGVIANGHGVRIRAFLRQFDLIHTLDPIVASGDFTFRKPDRAIFRYACALARRRPLECAMVGDSVENDVAGANRAGLWTIHLARSRSKQHEATSFDVPDDSIRSLAELGTSWILSWRSQVGVAVIAAGGAGKRMGPLTEAQQKCLLPVAGKPILSWVIDRLTGAGIERVVLLAKHRIDDVRQFVANRPDVPMLEVMEVSGRSTAAALYQAASRLKSEFLYVHGDILFSQEDLNRLLKYYARLRHDGAADACFATVPLAANLTHAVTQLAPSGELVFLRVDEWYQRRKDPLPLGANGYSLGLGVIHPSAVDWSAVQAGEDQMVEGLVAGASKRARVYGIEISAFGHLESPGDYQHWRDLDPDRALDT
jgi:HAD superfamily hydrolase (TIGR01549 family)